MRPQAEERLKNYLVLRKLAAEENLEVSDEEVEIEIDTVAATSRESEESIRRVFSTDSSRESLRSSLLNRKVMGRLVEIILGEDGAESPEDQPETPEDSNGDAEADPAETAAPEPDTEHEGA
jgi:trigger factor